MNYLLYRRRGGVSTTQRKYDKSMSTLAARLPGLKLLAALRAADVPAETDYLGRSLKSQMKHANRLNARDVVILGDEELQQGVATVRDMATSQQESVPLGQVVERLMM